MTSTISSDKKLHPLTAIQGKITTTTTLTHNLKFQQSFILAKETLKENVYTTTTVSSQTSSNLKSKGNNNSNTFFTLRKKFALERIY